MNRLSVNLKAASVLTALQIIVCSPIAADVQQSVDPDSKHKVVAEFTLPKNRELLVPVSINDEEYFFQVDTGSTISLFDISFREQLGDPVRTIAAATPGGSVDVPLFNAPKAYLGSVDISQYGVVACADVNALSIAHGQKIEGIIGMSLLSPFVVQIDYDGQKLQLFEPEEGEESDWGQPIPMGYNRRNMPMISATMLGTLPNYFVIDTGSDSGVDLYHYTFKRIVSDEKLPTVEQPFLTLGGTQHIRQTRLDLFQIKAFQYEKLVVGESPDMSRIGTTFLCRHVVTFDFPRKTLYLKKGKLFGFVEEVDMSGLTIASEPRAFRVYFVNETSPAYEAGVKANDIILRVNGRDAADYGLSELRKLLHSGDGKEINMTIRRGSLDKQITFRLKKVI